MRNGTGMGWDVLGLGAVAVDDLLYVDRYPPPDSKAEVRSTARQGGGLAATAMVAASRLGVRAGYCGILGDDDLSRYTLDELAREGVDTSAVLIRPGARPIHSIIVVDLAAGTRNIFFSPSGFTAYAPEELSPELISRARLLFVDHKFPQVSLRACELARRAGIPVVGDVEGQATPEVRQLARAVDHLIVGVEMAQRLTGEGEPARMARALADGRACAAVTAGAEGCWHSEGGAPARYTPALKVQTVDTTGCGDVFHGAYAAALARGLAIGAAIRVATVTAGLKAAHPGGRAGIPDWTGVERALQGAVP